MPTMNFVLKPTKVPRLIMIFFLIDIGLCIAYVMEPLIGRRSILTRLFNLDNPLCQHTCRL